VFLWVINAKRRQRPVKIHVAKPKPKPKPKPKQKTEKEWWPTKLYNTLPNSTHDPWFELLHDDAHATITPCNISGTIKILILNSTCQNPKFDIRIWNRNQVTALYSTLIDPGTLEVPYLIYASDTIIDGTFVSVTMMYCNYFPNNVRDNLILPSLLNSPQLLTLKTPPQALQSPASLDSTCPPQPPRWTMTDRPLARESMPMLLALVRSQYSAKYIPKRDYDSLFTYTDLPQCDVPAKKESICIVGDSHARSLQILLNKFHWKDGLCFHKSSVFNSQTLHLSHQPCPTDKTNRILYWKTTYLRADFSTEVDLSGCDDFLVTYGQWDLGFTLTNNYNQDSSGSMVQTVDSAFRVLVRNIVQVLSELKNPKRIYFLSMNFHHFVITTSTPPLFNPNSMHTTSRNLWMNLMTSYLLKCWQ